MTLVRIRFFLHRKINTPSSHPAAYITKLDTSGNFIWAKQFETKEQNSLVFLTSIFIDENSDCVATGLYGGVVDFDPNDSEHIMSSLDNSGQSQYTFITKLDKNGELVWVKEFKGNPAICLGADLTIDKENNIYIGGFFKAPYSVDFNPGNGVFILTPKGEYDGFIVKLDEKGDFIWAKQLRGTGVNRVLSIALDNENNVYTSGIFTKTTDFDPGQGIFNLSAGGNAVNTFVLKLSSQGEFIWADMFKSSGDVSNSSIAVNTTGVYTTGSFKSSTDFDTRNGSHIINVHKVGKTDGFIHKFSQRVLGNMYGKDSIIGCKGEPFTLIPEYIIGSSFLWNTGDTTASITVTEVGKYHVQINYCGQTYYDSIHLSFGPKPVVYIGNDTAFCGYVDYVIQPVTDEVVSYEWNTGDTTKILHVTQEGIYSLTVKDKNSCSNADTVLVEKIEYPYNALNKSLKICWDNFASLDAKNSGSDYLWNTGENSQIINVTESGTYWVTISNRFCSITDSIEVLFLTEDECSPFVYLPNAFSPNKDGLNDVYKAVTQNLAFFEMQLFNRWGEMIFRSTNPEEGWDGTVNGEISPSGVYTVIVSYRTSLSNELLRQKVTLHLIR